MDDAALPPAHDGKQVWTGQRDSLLTRLGKVRIGREPTSYAPVRAAIGTLVRNRRHQLLAKRVKTLKYVDIGCGWNTHADLINLDYSWTPAIDLCWNITKGLPFQSGSMDGIFSEHCLEHFPLPTATRILKECRRVLSPKGRIRIVVPDAEIYLRTYMKSRSGEAVTFPYQGAYEFEGVSDAMMDVNRIFYQDRHSDFGHRFLYDATMLEKLLRHVGFKSIERQKFRIGKEAHLLADTAEREVESLYMEAETA